MKGIDLKSYRCQWLKQKNQHVLETIGMNGQGVEGLMCSKLLSCYTKLSEICVRDLKYLDM